MRRLLAFIIGAICGIGIASSVSLAQTAGPMDQIVTVIQDAANTATSGVLPSVIAFFGILVVIGFGWAIVSALKK